MPACAVLAAGGAEQDPQPGTPRPLRVMALLCLSSSSTLCARPGELRGVSQCSQHCTCHRPSWLCPSLLCRGFPPSQTPTKIPALSGNHESCPGPPSAGHVLTKGFLCVRMAPGQARPFLLLLLAWHQLGQNMLYGSCSAFTAFKLAMDRARPVPMLGLVWGGQTCPDSTSDPNLPLGSYSSTKRGSENEVEPGEIPLQRLRGCLGAGGKLPLPQVRH